MAGGAPQHRDGGRSRGVSPAEKGWGARRWGEGWGSWERGELRGGGVRGVTEGEPVELDWGSQRWDEPHGREMGVMVRG